MRIAIEFSRRQLNAAESQLSFIANGLNKALSGAINDTAKSVKSAMSRRIREKVNIKKSDIDRNISISPKATPARLRSGIHLSKTKRLSLAYFGAREVKAGVSYKIDKSGSRK